MGYYPCNENILYDLTFCDPLGLNISTPPEALHAILLGRGTHLSNAFARLETEREEKNNEGEEEKEQDSEDEEEEEKLAEKKKRKNICFYWIFWKTGCNWIVRSWVLAGKAIRYWQDKTSISF